MVAIKMRHFQAYTQYEVARWEMHLYHSHTEFKCFLWYSKVKLFLLSFPPNLWFFQQNVRNSNFSLCLLFPVLKPLSFVNRGFFVNCMTFFMIIRSLLEQSCTQNSTTCCLFIQVCFLSLTFMQQLLSHISMSSQQE